MIMLKSEAEINRMAQAGRIVADALGELRARVKPGIATRDLDRFAEEFILKRGAIPAFKGYRNFPASLCTSVNDEIVHGIPSDRVLVEGDIIGMDLGAIVDGYYGDAAITVPVGTIKPEVELLLKVTEEALYRGIECIRPGNRLSDVSHAVQSFVEAEGYSVVRDFVGHGIGRELHEEPQIPNFGKPGQGPRLKVGMVLAIEPMVNIGDFHVRILSDNWTAVTQDGSLSAHFEHTVAVSDDGPKILTAQSRES
jgi:methionyl aminopeptidase